MVPPMQQMQGQRPGQMMQGQNGNGQVRLVRPGVVRGPTGALRTAMPANITHNPRHVVGKAGKRYNRQAFMFRRGKDFYRRAYYVGPDGGIFFYDESIPDDDPTLAEMSPDSLPTCPVDADDCQGFNDPAPVSYSVDPKAEALQLLVSLMPNSGWQENGWLFVYDEGETVVGYDHLVVEVTHALPFGVGPEQLWVRTRGLLGGGVLVYSGAYDANKAEWDRVIRAVRVLGVQPETPGSSDRDIRQVQ
jgi:hypothetical protein